MIRLILRRLIIPRGDTGTFSIPVLAGKDTGDTSIFTIFDPLTHRKIFEKVMSLSNGVLSMNLTHGDTVNLPVGQFVWDIKFYANPVFANETLVGGEEVDSYYAAFTLPVCEIRETGDNLIMADNAPTSTLRPDLINLIEAALVETTNAKDSAAASQIAAELSAQNASTSALNAGLYAADALSSRTAAASALDAAERAATAAIASASEAATSAAAVLAEMPTKISDLENDVGYLTEHLDISGKANSADLATVAMSGSYNDLSNKPSIPTKISDLTDDSGHYTKPVTGIPASDLAAGVLDVWSGLTYHTSTMSTDSDSFVLGGATDAPTEINKCLVTSTPDANVIPKFDYQGRLHSVTPEEEWDGSNAVATTEYVDNMISDNMPEIPTNVSELNNDAGYLTSFIETDPTVPSWAKAQNKPTYTASEVGAPTVAEMNSAIGTAIANVHLFELSILLSLPTQDIDTHTIYLIPKTGDTNDVYDEYIYINNAWEMIGNTQIDLSNYATLLDIPSVPVLDVQINGTSVVTSGVANFVTATTPDNESAIGPIGLVSVTKQYGITTSPNGTLRFLNANEAEIKGGTAARRIIVPSNQHQSAFYGLAKAAGDQTQAASENPVGAYTSDAKTAIQLMLDVPSNADLALKADKTNTVLETTLSRGRKNNTTVGGASLAFGIDTEASGYYSVALGLNTTASSQGAFAEGKNTVAHYIAHAEGEDSQALSSWSHAQNLNTIANGGASSASGRHTIANGADSFVFGRYNAADSYDNWPIWIANTSYEVGDRVKRNLMVQNEPTDVGYHCTVANSDATFDSAHWELDGYHMNYVEIVGNGKEYEDPETHQTIRAGSNAYALEWNGTAHYMGNIYVGANADSTGGSKVLCEADFATDTDIQNIINGGAGA